MMRRRRNWLAASLCAVLVLLGSISAAQAPSTSASEARALLLRMGQLLGKAQQLSVTAQTSYDTVQSSGEKVEWNELRRLTLSRPDRLRMETERSNGARTLVIFDGKDISAYDEVGRVYAQAPQRGGVDQSLVYLVRDLGVRLPLALLFVSDVANELERRVRSVEYVEKTGILGAPAHHLIGRTDTVNFQVWIADGDQPLPQRIVLTYPGAPGQPQFRAQFSAWNLAPETASSLFTFTAPENAGKIPFAAALLRTAPRPAAGAPKKGAK